MAEPSCLPPTRLAEPGLLAQLQDLAAIAARSATNHLGPSKSGAAAELSSYVMGLRASRVALHALARALILAGPAGIAAARPATAGPGPKGSATAEMVMARSAAPAATAALCLGLVSELERLLAGFVKAWQRIKAFEEAQAEEEAQQFKSKSQTTIIKTEEVGGGGGLGECVCGGGREGGPTIQ